MILGYDITSIGLESTVKRHQQTVGVKDNVHYCLYGVRMCSFFHSSITPSLRTPSSQKAIKGILGPLGKILALKKECVFEWGYLVESEVRTVGGKEKRFQKKTPLTYVLAPTADNAGGGEG